MSDSAQPFQQIFDTAWLALATYQAVTPPYFFDLAAQLAGLIDEGAPILAVQGSSSQAENINPHLDELLEVIEPNEVLRIALEEFSLESHPGRIGGLILYGGTPQDWVDNLDRLTSTQVSPELPRIDLTLLIGGPCAACGQWRITAEADGPIAPGMGWIPNAIVTPGIGHAVDLEPVRALLEQESSTYAIGLPEGSLLALGPGGEVEIWSEIKPAVVFGKGWGVG